MVVAIPQLARPVGVLEDLIDEEHLAASGIELAGKVGQGALGEDEIVEVDVEAFVAVGGEELAGVGEQEGGLTDLAAAFDADQALVSIYLVHQATPHGCAKMRH